MNSPFPDQMLAAPALLAYVCVKCWRPLAADGLVLLVTVLMVAAGRWLIRRGRAQITAHRNARTDNDFERIVKHEFGGRFPDDEPAQHLPGVTQLGPTPPPPGRRRRMPRIPGRPRVRRHRTTSSSSDRRIR